MWPSETRLHSRGIVKLVQCPHILKNLSSPYDSLMRRMFFPFGTLFALSYAFLIHAQTPSALIPASGAVGTCDFATGVLHFDCIPIYLGYLIQLLFVFASGAFLIGIIMGGYKYAVGSVTTQGKEAGKKELTGAIIGFCVVVLSYLLVDTILEALL